MHPLNWRLAAGKLDAAALLGGCNVVWLSTEAESFSDPPLADRRGTAPNKKQKGMEKSFSLWRL